MKIIDITQEFFSCRVYPGDNPPTYKRVRSLENNDSCNLTSVSMNVHNGTHIDAPNHFVAGGKAMHEMDLSLFFGVCTVAEYNGTITDDEIVEILKTCKERLLFKGQVLLTESTATILANSHVKLVGVEAQSVGGNENPRNVHVILLSSETIPLEGLNLSDVVPGEYTLAAFPLNMKDSDGSPVRAVLIDG